MRGSRVFLVLALLSVALISGSFALAAPPAPRPVNSTARYGAELGLLASAAGSARPQAEAAAAGPTAGPTDSPPLPTAEPTLSPTATPQTPEPTPSPAPKKGKLIFVDPGHGGDDPGAVHTAADGRIDLLEKEVNLWIGLKLADMLRGDGYDVEMSRTTDRFMVLGGSTPVELQTRIDAANRVGADLYVAVHNNGSYNSSLHGTEVYYCNNRGFASDNRRLAWLVQQALVRNLRQTGYDTADRGTKDDAFMGHYAVIGPLMIRPSRMPGIIGESLFVSNDADAAALQRADVREAIARGYFEGIKVHFGDS